MSARVVHDNTDPWETTNRLKVECLECGTEFGWTYERSLADLTRVENYALKHNLQYHPKEN